MKHRCSSCNAICEFYLTSRGWICPQCGAIYPFHWTIATRKRWFTRILSSSCRNQKHFQTVMHLMRTQSYEDLDQYCQSLAEFVPFQSELLFFQAIGYANWLPRSIRNDLHAGDPLPLAMSHLTNLFLYSRTYLDGCHPEDYPYHSRLVERTFAYANLLLEAAELDLLKQHPEHLAICLNNWKRMSSMHEGTLAFIPLLSRLTSYQRISLQHLNTLVSECRSEILQCRKVLSRELFLEAEALLPEQGRKAMPQVRTALHVCFPQQERMDPAWIHRSTSQRLEDREVEAKICIRFCHDVNELCPEMDLEPEWQQFAVLLDRIRHEKRMRSLLPWKAPKAPKKQHPRRKDCAGSAPNLRLTPVRKASDSRSPENPDVEVFPPPVPVPNPRPRSEA